ncbi:MAG: ATP-dependent Clp protease ATP-binding subunit [Deltaproteobacteria bacterium]|nr:ATP-dependent Clp protease ATP-binding subunit [Deltaproteobacteria bacterium]
MHASMELRQVLAEAEDIAAQVGQQLTSAHLLLALFTVANRAEILLKEKQIDEDVILAQVHSTGEEPDGTVKEIQKKASQIAAGCGSDAVDCLHLLIAICGMRQSLAYDLLRRCGLKVAKFRNTAMSYVTTALPRRLTIKKKSRAKGAPAVGPQVASRAPQPSAPPVLVEEGEELDAEPLQWMPEEPADQDGPPAQGSAWELLPSAFPVLSRLGRNLTALAASGRLDPLVGRDKELDEVVDTLLKRRANNPLLVGEPGVGKTAIVEGLAGRIVDESPEVRPLADRILVELDTGSLLAGTQLRGAFSEKLQQIRHEVAGAEGRVVVFFDEMHTLIGAGATGDGPQDAANELKSALARGEFPCIGATTHDEYRRFIEQDPALARRFQVIQVAEPSPEATLTILEGIAAEYAEHHGVSYDPQALQAAVHLSSRYITDRCLPDKAIGLLDLAGSRARRSGRKRVDREAVARVVSSVADIPVDRLLMTDAERLLNMEQILGLQIIGHTGVIRAIANVIRRNYAGFAHRRPIGSFLFLGPTGVGKTETARALAHFLFGSRDALVKLDMTEYAESHTVSRLIGSPPGYVGHHEGGQLTEAVRRRPYTIVLFDEVEKAHPEVQQLLLQIMDEGRLTDGRGRCVDFTNAVIICTSNLGSADLARPGGDRIGFGGGKAHDPGRDVLARARQALPPELWSRVDEHLFFRPLSADDLTAIATLLVKESSARLAAERGMRLVFDSGLSRHLVEFGCTEIRLGARPLRAAVRRLIEEPLAEAILSGRFTDGQRIRVRLEGEALCFEEAATGEASFVSHADSMDGD